MTLMLSLQSSSNRLVWLFAIALATVFASGLVAGGVPKWLVVYAAAGCAVLCSRRLALDKVSLAALAFMGWAAVSLAWSSDPDSGALQLHKLAIVFVLFCAARAWGRKWPLATIAAVSVGLILAMAPVVKISGFGNENFITDYLLMLSPFLVAFWWDRYRAWGWLPLLPL